jgi:hypothetical protein
MKPIDDLQIIQDRVFDTIGLKYTPANFDVESSDYHACSFSVEGRSIKYRQAKITPTKNGQFVTLWKRKLLGPIQPFDSSDDIDFVLVAVRRKSDLGLFIFPKEALVTHGVFSLKKKGGKRAMRVYPAWDKAESKQAEKTQKWQLDYFLEIPNNKSIDTLRCKTLIKIGQQLN